MKPSQNRSAGTTEEVRTKSAWLVTWEGTGGVPKDPVVAILNHRLPASSVKDLVELLYASLSYSFRDKLLVAKNRGANPYQATMTRFQHIHCGDNPFLHARLVSDLGVVDGTPKWKEPPSETERRVKISQ